MTFVDAIIILIILAGLVMGYSKGLIKQASSIIAWVAGIVVCYWQSDAVTALFTQLVPNAVNWPMASVTVKIVALAFTFLAIMLLLRVVSYLLRGLLKVTRTRSLDRWGGAILFAFKYLFLLSIVLNLLYAINPNFSTFGTRHMLANKPYEWTLDLMPMVLGSDKMPSDSLLLYRETTEPLPQDTPSVNQVQND